MESLVPNGIAGAERPKGVFWWLREPTVAGEEEADLSGAAQAERNQKRCKQQQIHRKGSKYSFKRLREERGIILTNKKK